MKRIPDPVAKLGRKKGGTMSPAEFRAQEGVLWALENFDFEAQCKILGFEMARVPKKDDAKIEKNSGGRFRGGAVTIKDAAKRGDTYFFSDIKAKCPGDIHGRELNPMVFKIR